MQVIPPALAMEGSRYYDCLSYREQIDSLLAIESKQLILQMNEGVPIKPYYYDPTIADEACL